MDFADLIAPVGLDRFMAEHWDKTPLHIPAVPSAPAPLMGWSRLNELLSLRSHWTEANINLIMNSRAVGREHYMDEVATQGGLERRADPAKVQSFLAMGASLVANAIEDVAPEVRRLTHMLAAQFAGVAGANLYCSFKGIQAFASHFDNHEVFATQCEGEKTWRIYRNRADAPLDPVLGQEEAQGWIDSAKGAVLMEVRMRPGDRLYIPRGYFHDALATSAESLHLTLAVAPHTGRLLFRLLEQAALAESPFRQYLPDGRQGRRNALQSHVDKLAQRIAQIMRSPAFATEIVNAQRKLERGSLALSMPIRSPLEAWSRTERRGAVIRRDEGAMLEAGGEYPLGYLAEEAEWLLSRPAFLLTELATRYPHRSHDELKSLTDLLVRVGLFQRYRPQI